MKFAVVVLFCSALGAQQIALVRDGQLWLEQARDGSSRAVANGNLRRPAISGDGAWVAFLDGDQLGVVAWAGGEVRRPLGAQPVSDYKWSSGGATLAVVTEDSVYVTSAAGGWNPSRVFAGDPDAVVFSPDRRQIAISSIDSDPEGMPKRGKLEVFPVDLSGAGRVVQTAAEWEQIVPFAWTGDTMIAWKGEISGSAASDGFDVWGFPVPGGAPRKLNGPVLLFDRFSAVSPDGKMLALTSGEGRQAWTNKAIAVVDLKTGEARTLTSGKDAALYPAWSPDGKAIAFISGPDAGDVWGGGEAEKALNQRRLWVMDADGSHKRQLTNDSKFRDERPMWSADGKSVVFLRIENEDQASVWKIDAAGGEPERLTGAWAMHDEEWFGDYGCVDWFERVSIR